MESSDVMSEKGKKIWTVKQEVGAQRRTTPPCLLLNIYLGGKFHFSNHKTEYLGGSIYMKEGICVDELKMPTLRGIVMAAQKSFGYRVHDRFSMWYRMVGRNLTNGRKKIENDFDIDGLYKTKDLNDKLVLYVIDEPKPHSVGPQFRSKSPSFGPSTSQPFSPAQTVAWSMPKHFTQSIPQYSQTVLSQTSSHPITETHMTSQKNPPFKAPNLLKGSPVKSDPILAEASQPQQGTSDNPTPNFSSPTNTHPFVQKRSTPRVKHVATKKKATQKKTSKVKRKQGNGKKKGSKKLFKDDSDLSGDDCSGVDLSDYEYEPGEEDRREDVDDELFFNSEDKGEDVLKDFQGQKGGTSKGSANKKKPRWAKDFIQHDNVVEEVCDSDEERSLHDSDCEGERFPTFNADTDLKGKVKLTLGLKFDSIYTLRKAVQHHSIQNRYDYYFQHNGTGRFEVFCRNKCDCPWNTKKARFLNCHCSKDKLRCFFKVKAIKLPMSDQYQIRSLHLEHDCGFFHSSSKVTSSYLAEKYLDDWKADPYWGLKKFVDRVYRDLGVKIGYYKAWFTRARVKQILYGDDSEQYAKVYEYAFAILKYNPGSTAIVSVENSDNSAPHFSRMYVCLEACKSGYKQGCRPFIGVDGCHLKGAYPGMILVAVSKDGNNNIFPIAWAIVEVENTSTWTWFLELLTKDTGHSEGEGLTLMSDRQKGLLEAISVVAPKADVRFCVRHIWANFKLKFSGTIFKEFFWRAAKATTKQDFDKQLGSIRFLSEEAYNFLKAIPSKHWSRHGFTTTAKSNMVTNNLCETFNAVIREARDKPVITCMEWIRRYIMRRHAEKWDGIQTYNGRFMPYIGRVLGWVKEGSKKCIAMHSRTDEWEVDTTDDRMIVNLRTNFCSCNHFMLTGIPCAHAWACIVGKRGKPEDYVDGWYTKEKFMQAYSSHIRPMPGLKHWDPCSMPQPLPPVIKNMPGRPSLKKRKKEAGEEEQGNAKKLKKPGGKQKCSNCGEHGHKKNSCSKAAAPKAQPKQGGRPCSNDPWVVASRKKKEDRAKKMTYVPPSVSEERSAQNVQYPPTQSSQNVEFPPSQSSDTASNRTSHPPVQNTRHKLPMMPTKKKVKSLKADLLIHED